ncbi:uncharacterized protein YrzB (UPF0473 family) [Paenibacillus forsythiae]|uniref:Uncharacterized protein YrzB (UPF0473 family) n=1 Tax=Paenibacillus forsythiae TaxID=365616 RepID=A0ABU3H4E8_9BACL|nr:DUF1292 domain-containing protein [Paenibacillus forsythiae]MDT3425695.1 uncharacterized protein YrzB (UPF0473 family) [Paenibacillus forsythiae]
MSDHKHEHGEACCGGHGHHHGHEHGGDGCSCGHNHEHEEFVLTLTNEQGEDVEMVLVETFDVADKLYALLLERENPEADGIILRMEEEDEEMVLYNIEDEAEWKAVEEAYNELLAKQG